MKFSGNQKRLYLIAIALLLVTLTLCLAWTVYSGNDETLPEIVPTPAPTPDTGVLDEPSREVSAAPMMDTVVYYQDNYGYLVPVMRSIAAEEGIAKATLSLMVKSVFNDMEAARLGLRTVIPEGTTFDLDISKGVATIDLSKEALNSPDAVSEVNMVRAVVETLSEFSTVDKVRFLVGGKQTKQLKHGTSVEGDFTSGALNLESASADDIKNAKTVMLYFTGDSPSLIVPVTRVVYGAADVETAVLELVKGPSALSPLEGVIPSGCGLIGVEVKDGVARINFTQDFIRVAEQTDGGRLALKALVLTCTQFKGIKSVEILVDGEPYDPGEGTLATPAFINTAADVADAFIQTQSSALFDFD